MTNDHAQLGPVKPKSKQVFSTIGWSKGKFQCKRAGCTKPGEPGQEVVYMYQSTASGYPRRWTKHLDCWLHDVRNWFALHEFVPTPRTVTQTLGRPGLGLSQEDKLIRRNLLTRYGQLRRERAQIVQHWMSGATKKYSSDPDTALVDSRMDKLEDRLRALGGLPTHWRVK